jgi:hypothetical protein
MLASSSVMDVVHETLAMRARSQRVANGSKYAWPSWVELTRLQHDQCLAELYECKRWLWGSVARIQGGRIVELFGVRVDVRGEYVLGDLERGGQRTKKKSMAGRRVFTAA